MRAKLKYIIIPFIALGLGLSGFLGIIYTCTGDGGSPNYNASPFIFRKNSLGSSLTYFYSICGVVLNTIFWTGLIVLIRLVILKLIQKSRNSDLVKVVYNTTIGILLVLSAFIVFFSYQLMGNGFEKEFNYWYINVGDDSVDDCEGEWKSLSI